MSKSKLAIRFGATGAFLLFVGRLMMFASAGGCPRLSPASNDLLGSNVVPPVDSAGFGTARYELIEGDTKLKFVIQASGLSAPVTAAGFYVPEPGLAMGRVAFSLTEFVTEVDGEVAIAGISDLADWESEDPLSRILAYEVSVILGTEIHPQGEVRGWVTLLGNAP